jgi:CRP-like cAMP-binding protein
MYTLRQRVTGFCSQTSTHVEWDAFSPSEIALLDRTRRRHGHRQGETIFNQDDEPQGIYCLEEGHVLLWRLDAFNNETAFQVVSSGEMLGCRSFFAEEHHAATARALVDCRAYLIPRTTMHQLLDSNPALVRWFLRAIASDPGPPDALLLHGSHVSIRMRLVNLLIILKDLFASADPEGQLVYELPVGRREIAALVEARPETVARAIRELDKEGLASFHRRRVVVPRLDRLIEAASSDPFS